MVFLDKLELSYAHVSSKQLIIKIKLNLAVVLSTGKILLLENSAIIKNQLLLLKLFRSSWNFTALTTHWQYLDLKLI